MGFTYIAWEELSLWGNNSLSQDGSSLIQPVWTSQHFKGCAVISRLEIFQMRLLIRSRPSSESVQVHWIWLPMHILLCFTAVHVSFPSSPCPTSLGDPPEELPAFSVPSLHWVLSIFFFFWVLSILIKIDSSFQAAEHGSCTFYFWYPLRALLKSSWGPYLVSYVMIFFPRRSIYIDTLIMSWGTSLAVQWLTQHFHCREHEFDSWLGN